MTSTCPTGHASEADDYCDVCGLPIGADAAAAPAEEPADAGAPSGEQSGESAGQSAGAAAAAAPVPEAPEVPDAATCPNCQASNPPNALFCEACGYDFTTGTMPRPVTPSPLDLSDLTGFPPASPSFPPPSFPPPSSPPPSSPPSSPPAGEAEPEPAAPAEPAVAPLAPALDEPWVAEVWIDPDWYAEQDSADPLPSAGVPQVIRIPATSALVGRTSRSRGIHPDVDLASDTGISRRHCQLTTDGTRWWVEDLGSSNGTYVGSSVGTLPRQPLPPGEKREVAPGERIYLGAWTRIVVRRGQPGEV
ncbi:FHA domain-containing protein [Nocardioides sp. YIM 152588]|uniref:FHA domain-containing protein n=1 Tax=Nocardioides sp. YIM 152588 TaxID=3158259 RepID=UPI0032E41905